ncbi:acetylornithine transaminase [Deferribacter desulfuricans SSM1]|uniref:Acetylornithine aminotransferase n=1 Tax=Deferribacter desulfuricans (strain DSM 14783 / JCM 11476 / NBRC 101012 / SSM1) TaxID=639282 RepID=D3P8P7_DEFDS|nr:aspartate aminotransferase family protein [Deferribacter desulfuricans]BAI81087.1 acetylornithine transaminase [Deferribacter desulfuricans SSM1]
MSFVMNTYSRFDLEFVKGDGSYLFDKDGNRYLDFASGIAVTNLGHANKEIAEVICNQAKTLLHTSNLYKISSQEELAEKLSKRGFGGKVFFCNSGAEANEAAIKLAKIYGNKKYDGVRYKIVTMEGSFHGRTYATLSATGQEKVKKGFEPPMDFFVHVPYNDYDSLYNVVKDGDVIAIMLEVIQGEGGLKKADIAYLKNVRELCNRLDILLIFDEVQTGIGRTGKLFAYQHYDVIPDVITLAKGLGNGVPIGAMMAKEQFAEYLSPGTHASTFGGNYLACAVANKVLDLIDDELLQSVQEKGLYLKSKLKEIFSGKGEVRGEGLMLGVALNDVNNMDFINELHKEFMLAVPAGDNVVRLYPPLTVTKEEIDEGITKLEKVINKLWG